MELWIRTQNKLKLSKAIEFNVIYREHMWIIEGYDELGRYKTKDRALEVLDEIQTILRGKYATSFDYKISLKGFKTEEVQQMLELMAVYEMPIE